MNIKIAVYQMEDRGKVEENIKDACKKIQGCNADFFCLPEYFAIPSDYKERKGVEDAWEEITKPALRELAKTSEVFRGYIVAGSLVEKEGSKYYNTCFVFKSGKIIGKHRKVNLIREELELGLSPGSDVRILSSNFFNFSILICADGVRKDLLRKAAEADVIFFPTSLTDPKHPKVKGQPVFQKIAREYSVIIVKSTRILADRGAKSAVVTPTAVYETKSYEDELLEVELAI